MDSSRRTLAALGLMLGVCLVMATPASAQVEVFGPFPGAIEGGDWPGTYGECFYLIPEPELPANNERPVGPDMFSVAHEQYRENNCYGGPLFSNFPDESGVDFRVFRNNDPANAFAFQPTAAIVDEAAQYNPCIGAPFHATWDDDDFVTDPLSVALSVDVTGSIEVAYYFVQAAGACRRLQYALIVDGEERATGMIEDFAGGKYVVFELDGLEGPTMIRLDAKIDPSLSESECPATTTPGNVNVNSHISGVFVSGDCLPEPEECDDDCECSDSSSSSSDSHDSGSSGSSGSHDSGSSGSSGASGKSGSSDSHDSGSAGSSGSSGGSSGGNDHASGSSGHSGGSGDSGNSGGGGHSYWGRRW